MVDNGGGPMIAIHTPSNTDSLCDGSFHSISATKSGLTISLTVDSNAPIVVFISDVKYLSVDTASALFIAGVPGELHV